MTIVQRYKILPKHGKLLISTDLHGNWCDFHKLCQIFADLPEAKHWVILGDAVHGPSPQAQQDNPILYGFPDQSWQIVAGIIDLQRQYPERVHYVLGNHDYAHIGGPVTRKFYPNEAMQLEAAMTPEQIQAMHQLFQQSLLAVVAPCNVLLTHGAPDDTLQALADLNSITFPPTCDYHRDILTSFLTHYGQNEQTCLQLLTNIALPGMPLSLVIHGHDRHERGWFTEGNHQLCPVLFGAPKHDKRYVILDLSKNYHSCYDIQEERELLRLHVK